NQSGLDENSLQIAFNHIEYLECELNRGGLSSREVEMLRGIEIQNNISLFSKSWSRSLLDRIELCAFNVESAELNAPERSRTCPVTLCEPETGVFMKNSNSSNVCSLYDKAALIHLIDIKAHHPLSRESITTSMIIGKDECHFDSKIEAFVASDT
ncbi:T3SS effector NleG family protein, partial [Escherichia albertii]